MIEDLKLPVQAAVFDMDGTLVDSELLTEQVTRKLLREQGLDARLDYTRFHGRTWKSIEQDLKNTHPRLSRIPIARRLQEGFHRLFVSQAPRLVPGAREVFLALAARLPVAIASSSNRESIEHVLGRMQAANQCRVVVAAEDVLHPKPDPECYLLAARHLGVDPEDCLVFEDSLAGLESARAAGMQTVAITRRATEAQRTGMGGLARACIRDFRELDPRMLATITGQGDSP